MRKILLHGLVALCVGVGFFFFWRAGVLEPFELRVNDTMLQLRGPVAHDERIVIVDIDERSLKALGQWPWSRNIVAQLLHNLAAMGAGIVGLDIVFAEPDASSPALVLSQLGVEYENAPDYDGMLADVISATPTVPGYVFAMQEDGIAPHDTPKHTVLVIERQKPLHVNLFRPHRAILNLPMFEAAAYTTGYFNTVPDGDGVVRSIPLVMEFRGVLYPALSLEMVRLALGLKRFEVQYNPQGIVGIGLGERAITTDALGRMMVGYHGPSFTYRYISALDVVEGRMQDIEGAIVLVGTSAAGLLDLRSTPFDSVYPGVEVHANAIDNLLNGSFLSRPSWAQGVDFMAFAGAVLLGFVLLIQPLAWVAFLGFGGVVFALLGAHFWLLVSKGILLATVLPLSAFSVLLLVGFGLNYFLESRQKEQIKKKFAAKVSSAVMEDLIKNEGDVFAAHEREITVFFSDVRNFTNISESMPSPKVLIAFMNELMDPMTDIIIKHKGTVDKFMGDAIMAYWNAPSSVPNHADVAVGAALEQLHALKALNAKIKQDPRFEACVAMAKNMGVEPVAIGIGLNSGPAIVGEMGSSSRSDYTAIGDAINLGARIESLCKYYGSTCQISHFTKERLEKAYSLRLLDKVRVKGKKEAVEIWQVHDFKEGLEGEYLFTCTPKELEEELAHYHAAMAQYHQGAFALAKEGFEALLAHSANPTVCALYVSRCEQLIKEPPQGEFDGIFEHKTKG